MAASCDNSEFEYSKKLKKYLITKFKKENPLLLDDIIIKYLRIFKQKQPSNRIVEKDITKYTFSELKKIIDYSFPQLSTTDETTHDVIYEDNGLVVYSADTKEKCIVYGRGEKWCICKRNAYNRYNTYRYRYSEISFYFVYDSDRTDVFSKLVILVDTRYKYYVANMDNDIKFNGSKEVSWDDILNYQPKLIHLKHLFIPIPLTAEERSIYNLIKDRIDDDLFTTYDSYDVVESYIDCGYQLNKIQFINLPKELKYKHLNFGYDIKNDIFDILSEKEINYYFYHNIKTNDGSLNLNKLTHLPANIKFPTVIHGDLNLSNITSLPDNVRLPDIVNGSLYMNRLLKIENNIKLPSVVLGSVYFNYIVSLPDNIIFPTKIGKSLYLNWLAVIPSNIQMPSEVGDDLVLSKVILLPDEFKFPVSVGGFVFLGSLKYIQPHIILPNYIGGHLDISNIHSLINNQLPKNISGQIFYKN